MAFGFLHMSSRMRSVSVRSLIVGGVIVAFLTIASVIDPAESPATSIQGPNTGRGAESLPNGSASGRGASSPLLGELEGRKYRVEIYGGGEAPEYTVYDAEGELLVERARADEVYASIPDLDIRKLNAQHTADVPLSDDF